MFFFFRSGFSLTIQNFHLFFKILFTKKVILKIWGRLDMKNAVFDIKVEKSK